MDDELLYEVIAESELHGEPYILLCRKCSEYNACLIIHVQPIEVNEYRIVLKGMIVSVYKNKPLDEQVEHIMRVTTIIKYLRDTVSFYIPRNLTITVYNRICREHGETRLKPLPIEEAMIYLGEENGSA